MYVTEMPRALGAAPAVEDKALQAASLVGGAVLAYFAFTSNLSPFWKYLLVASGASGAAANGYKLLKG